MTRAAIIASALVLTGVMTYGILSLTDTPLSVSVIETASNKPGISAVTFTGREQEARGATLFLHGTVRFRTNPAERPNPEILVFDSTQANDELIATALDNGDIVATLDPGAHPAGFRDERRDLTEMLHDAQQSEEGPFGQIFTNPTIPPASRINNRTG